MQTFTYQGLDQTGKRVTGQVSAEDERGAIAQVKAQGLFPTGVTAVETSAAENTTPAASAGASFGFGRNLGSDLTVLTRQLSNLVAGGIPLMSSLAALTEHTESAQIRSVLTRIQQDVQAGKPLGEAFGAYPDVFPPLYVNMVKAGEASGQLSAVLEWLAAYQEKEQERRLQIRSALMYPTVLLSAGILAVVLLVTLVVPKFVGMFEEFGQALPLPTMVVLGVSGFMGRWGWLLLIAIVGMILGTKAYSRTPTGRYQMDLLKLRIPLVKKLGLRAAVSRFSRTTSTLLQGGVPLLDSLAVVRDVLGNEVLARAVDQAREGMREGESFASRLKQTGMFPPLLTHMIGIGEETGDLRSMLNTVANTYDTEVETTIKSMVSLLEPLIIITIGIMIGFIIVAMLLPIFQINVFAG